jgi:hypothetical protein
MDIDEPRCATLRKDKDDPKFKKSNIDIEDPIRANDLTDKEDPRPT